jgi:hypothetical protein
MTPARLALELGRSPKVLRAFLRREFPRDAADHGSNWSLTTAQVAAARRHFGQFATPASDLMHPTPVSSPTGTGRLHNTYEPPPLKEYVRRGLDVLFVALNPPTQSASNGHWFSGEQSSFFKLLFLSGLITESLPKAKADEIVFGSTSVNYKGAAYGVTDLRPELVETNSGKVRVRDEDVARFLDRIAGRKYCWFNLTTATAMLSDR